MAEPEKTETTSPTMAERITELKKELQILIIKIVEEDYSCLEFNDAQRILSELRKLSFKRSQEIFGDHFRCYISKEIMSDPVVLASGQTYDRRSIQSWLNAGNLTCPKTKQTLSDTNLIPNILVKDIIPHWCKNQGIKPPANPVHAETCMSTEEEARFESLFKETLIRVSALKEAAKDPRNPFQVITAPACSERYDNLINLLYLRPDLNCANDLFNLIHENPDMNLFWKLLFPLKEGSISIHPNFKKHLIRAIRYISAHEDIKEIFKFENSMVFLIDCLQSGSDDTRCDAIEILILLSKNLEINILIGKSGGVETLVNILDKESDDEILKKTAVRGLVSLCKTEENKGFIIMCDGIRATVDLIRKNVLVDGCLALLASLSNRKCCTIWMRERESEVVPLLLRFIANENASEVRKEHCICIIYSLYFIPFPRLDRAHFELKRKLTQLNGPIFNLSMNGTELARRKAKLLLDGFRDYK
ncbi:Armadillo [Macleaya cordata]|uniref:RING-type E3 ubiquitin transferase n=1 Tax=Macleaya cordata TaxID=56857 RepID=A0A200PTU5_MACCD|nr:Armadillo [Macleaya cordata]